MQAQAMRTAWTRIPRLLGATLVAGSMTLACASDPYRRPVVSDSQLLGSLAGGIAGAALGAAVGSDSREGRNAAIGGVTGAVLGGWLGGEVERRQQGADRDRRYDQPGYGPPRY